jgi:hypothetical protein
MVLFYYLQAKLGSLVHTLCQKRVANTDVKAKHAEKQLCSINRNMSSLFHGGELLRHILGRLKVVNQPASRPVD